MQNKRIVSMRVAVSSSNTNESPIQISVKEASVRLQLTEIRIDAVKVGKKWFIELSGANGTY